MRHLSRRPGFNRVELGVVLVIALLALGLFLVYLPQARVNSQRVQCMENLRKLGQGIMLFHGAKEGPKIAGGQRAFLPAARIADGYATWPVQIAPMLSDTGPLKPWDMQRRYDEQPAAVREAIWPLLLCPARPRTGWLGGEGDQRGAVGDYACVSGNGDPQRPWTGPDANGPIILGEVLEQQGGLILRWRGRTTLADVQKRGLSYTFLLGEKHVPEGQLGQQAVGDGPIYDGAHPVNSARVAGVGFGLASGPSAPFNFNFGSHHDGIVQFLVADGSVRVCTVDMSEEVLGPFATRGD